MACASVQGGWRDFIPAVALLIIGISGIAIATLQPSRKGGEYAVVAPPWYGLGQTISLIRAADGRVADTVGPTNIIIAYSDNPAFVEALYRAGAWLVIDPIQSRGCVGVQSTNLEGN